MTAFDVSFLIRALAENAPGWRVEWRECCDSTNNIARDRAIAGEDAGFVCIAERQSAGRGRLGRPWHSMSGCGLYLSVLLRPQVAIEYWTRWTLGAGVALHAACEALGFSDLGLKWPNDLLRRRRKIAGILAEGRASASPSLVLGVGVNVFPSQEPLPEGLEARVGWLLAEPGPWFADTLRERLASGLLSHLKQVNQQLENGDWDSVRAEWERRAAFRLGHAVQVEVPEGPNWDGQYLGLDDHGGLRVQKPTGERVSVTMADTIHWYGKTDPRS